MSHQIINSSAVQSEILTPNPSTTSVLREHLVDGNKRLRKKQSSKVATLRLQIKAQIKNIESEVALEAVGEMLKNLSTEQLISQITKPKRATLTVEDLIKDQKYKGFDRVGFDKLVAELAVEEPIEELLALANS